MTEQEIEAFRQTVDAQIKAVVTACSPYWWKDGDWKEAKEATGCIHPLDRIAPIEWLAGVPIFGCMNCEAQLDRDLVKLRVDQSGTRMQ